MGSGLGSALTKMVLLFLDVLHYMQHIHPCMVDSSLAGRCTLLQINSCQIILLEMRYMDDYCALWKFAESPSTVSFTEAQDRVNASLLDMLHLRYPLPLEEDTSLIFIGLELSLGHDGSVGIMPSCVEPPNYEGVFDFPGAMVYQSFAPESVKRSLVCGILSRIQRLTTPASLKPVALSRFCDMLKAQGFPRNELRKWSLKHPLSSAWAPLANF